MPEFAPSAVSADTPASCDPVVMLNERFAQAIRLAFPELGMVEAQITASRNPKFGDFQCNAAMTIAKQLGKPPREVAQAIVERVDLRDLAEPLTSASIAGPGFINVALKPEALADLVVALDAQSPGGPTLGVANIGAGRTIVVDVCGVNLAKQMHVGHLRATIIGDAMARVLARQGFNVIRQNHVGDWGLPIAMVTSALMQLKAQGKDIESLGLDAIEKLYRSAQKDCDADEKGLLATQRFYVGPKAQAEIEEQVAGASEHLARAKDTLLKLQRHEPETFGVWQRIADVTMGECLKVCARLHTLITSADSAGESSYADELAPLIDDLIARKVAEVDRGALVVHVPEHPDPCLVRKSDGGFLYATTDMAAIKRRVQTFGAERVVYCVDARQALHFKLVFAAAKKAGYTTRLGASAPSVLQHAAFGMVLGEDNKPFKTRSGDNVKLADLLDESIERSERVVQEKNPELSAGERTRVAEAVGIAAIKYADLSNDRIKDYVFSFDRMLAFEGNTGPYLLYALVRIKSIFRKAKETGFAIDLHAALSLNAPEEKALALALLRYPGVVQSVGESLEPHRMCGYLFDLAGAFSGFFTNCPVLQAPDERARASRLRLCAVTERVLVDGLTLLGIPTLERM